MAKATFLEKENNLLYSSFGKSKSLSIGSLGIHKTCPFEFGLISRKA